MFGIVVGYRDDCKYISYYEKKIIRYLLVEKRNCVL